MRLANSIEKKTVDRHRQNRRRHRWLDVTSHRGRNGRARAACNQQKLGQPKQGQS